MNNITGYPHRLFSRGIDRLGLSSLSMIFFVVFMMIVSHSWAGSDSNSATQEGTSEGESVSSIVIETQDDQVESHETNDDSDSAEPWGVEQLLAGLAVVKEAELEFIERKQSFLLTVEIESRGDIIYRAPDYMKKTVREPIQESIAIDGDTLTIEKSTLGGKKEEKLQSQSLTISENALANSAVGSIMAVMSGDKTQLLDGYDVTMSGPRDAWSLILKPKLDVVKEKIEQVALSGSHFEVNLIETTFPDGEQSRLELSYLVVR